MCSGAFSALVGLLTFAGWAFDVPVLLDWSGNGITMKTNAALCAWSAGAAVLLLASAPARAWLRAVASALGGFCAVVGFLTLLEHLMGWNFGIDTLLFDEPPAAPATVAPNRMGPPASTTFALTGTALVLLSTGSLRVPYFARGLAVASLCIGSISVLGYLFGASMLFAIGPITGIAFQTAVTLCALALGTVALSLERTHSVLLGQGPGGKLARELSMVALAIPILVGYLSVLAQHQLLIEPPLTAALVAIVTVGTLLAFIVRAAALVERATNARTQSEGRYRALMENLPGGAAFVLDRNLRYVVAGGGALQTMDLPPTLEGRTIWEVLDPEWAERFAPFYRRALQGESISWEHESRGRSYASRAVPLRDEHAGVYAVLAVSYDITEQKGTQQALREADRRKDEFLATLAHELRNPLAPIRNAVQILKEPALDEQRRRWCRDVIDRQVQHMARLLDDLLDVSRITRGTLELRKEALSIRSAIDAAIEAAQPALAAKSHALELDLPAEPIVVQADRVRLVQILGNLLNNAAKYTDTGGRIQIRAAVGGAHVDIHVKDNGAGLTPELKAQLFEMFTQDKRTLDRAEGGLGVGLAITRGLVELHGGHIEGRSDGPGKGSEFIVRLPLSPSLRAS